MLLILTGLNKSKDKERLQIENICCKDILSELHNLLLENLDPEKASRQLFRFGVLTFRDKEKIEENLTRKQDKNEQLLQTIREKGPGAYENFLEALEKGQWFLACQLLKKGRYIAGKHRWFRFKFVCYFFQVTCEESQMAATVVQR